MGTTLADILADRNYQEPPEIQQIKEFVKSEIGVTPKVSIHANSYVIAVPSAAAAGTLRSSIFKLEEKLETNRKLLIRIG